MQVTKQVRNIVNHEEGSFSVMASFTKQAKKEAWSQSEIKHVLDKAMEGNYHHLLNVIQSYSY